MREAIASWIDTPLGDGSDDAKVTDQSSRFVRLEAEIDRPKSYAVMS